VADLAVALDGAASGARRHDRAESREVVATA
jgi:hypothetical protein